MRPTLLRLLLLAPLVSSEAECDASGRAVREPSGQPELLGMEEAKAAIREAITLPLQMADLDRIFWRSAERGALLLSGPAGSGKRAAAEAAASEANAQVLHLGAREAQSNFCRTALAASSTKPVLVLIEDLESAPEAALRIRRCLGEVARAKSRVVCVATAGSDPSAFLQPRELFPFGFVVRISAPGQAERKQFLLKLLAQVSRSDAQWAAALRESAVDTLANLTENYTFAEMDFVVRRTFLRSTNEEGGRDPVALHHFEKILAETPAQSLRAYQGSRGAPGAQPEAASDPGKPDKKKKTSKDPMESIFGWCNFWLPAAFHLPPVVWAMVIFGLMAHLMARSTYQPYSKRKNRPERGNRSSLFGDLSTGANPYGSLGENLGEWPLGSPFGNPGMPMPGMPGMPMPGMPGMPGMPNSAGTRDAPSKGEAREETREEKEG